MRVRAALTVAVAVAVVGLQATSASARPLAPVSWSVAGFLDHQPPYGGGAPPASGTPLASISCPSASLCVAGDAFANIAATTNPSAGPAAWQISHVQAGIAPLSSGIGATSCPAVSLCVALGPTGNVLSSTDPAGGTDAWKVTHVEGTSVRFAPGLTALACPSTSLCVAGDRDGTFLTTRRPYGGSWRTNHVGFDAGFIGISGISCPTTSFCAATDGRGHVIISTNPTGGTSAWKIWDVDGRSGLYGISCVSRSMCVAVDGNAVLTSTNPTGGPSAWKRSVVDQALFRMTAVTCPSASVCVAVDQSGNVITSTDPTGGASAWRVDAVDTASSFAGGIPPLSGLTAISCPSPSFCVAVDSAGNAVRSTNPTGGNSAWTIEPIDGRNGPDGLTCPAGWCVAVDQAGNMLSSTQPANPSSWRITTVDPAAGSTSLPGAVSCPSPTFCAAVDGDANVITSSTPLGGSGWTTTGADPGHKLASVSCPSFSLCVAVDEAGNAVVSTDPTDRSPTWTVSHVDADVTSVGAQAALDDVSCPSVSMCIAVDNAGNVLSSTNPTGGATAWTPSAVDEGTALAAVSCPSVSLCVAAGGSTILVSTAPATGTQSWSAATIPGTPTSFAMQRISCTGTAMCVGNDQNGDVLSSDDPGGGGATWRLTPVEQYGVGAVACSPTSSCFALDFVGNVLVGAQPTVRQLMGKSLRAAAVPPGSARRIGLLLSRGGYWLTQTAPLAGRLTVTWRLFGTRTTVAAARVSLGSVQAQTFEVTLTRAGRRLLRRAKRPRVKATATYTPVGSQPITVSAALTLRR
jgi:hypothetical protein